MVLWARMDVLDWCFWQEIKEKEQKCGEMRENRDRGANGHEPSGRVGVIFKLRTVKQRKSVRPNHVIII
jgi:hypothetical protein